jgi:hypothetical protein
MAIRALLNEAEEIPLLDLETVWSSEAVLGRDWLSPEEDEAWKEL